MVRSKRWRGGIICVAASLCVIGAWSHGITRAEATDRRDIAVRTGASRPRSPDSQRPDGSSASSSLAAWSTAALVLLAAAMAWQIRQKGLAQRRAQEASAAKSNFLANMSHELRTPLNGILGVTEMLSATELNAEQQKLADIIRSSATTLLALVTDILDFSNIETGKLRIEPGPFSLRECVDGVCRLFEHRARDKGLTLEAIVAPDIPPVIVGDELRVRQILIKLIGNAVKFTAQGGVIVQLKPAGDHGRHFAIMFRVSDTGIGISTEVQAKLFKPFTQAETAAARRFGGTGLGLAIAHRLVQCMGGTIGVESESGKGATFWFLLPLAAPETVKSTVPCERGSSDVTRGRVLIAEDNAVNQMVVSNAVRKLGYEAHTVSNGLEAVEAIGRERYDLVLMDCQMPHMDGFQAATEIRRLPGSSRLTPIVAVTANAIVGDRERCLAAGMDDYLTKPVRLAALADALERWTSASGRPG